MGALNRTRLWGRAAVSRVARMLSLPLLLAWLVFAPFGSGAGRCKKNAAKTVTIFPSGPCSELVNCHDCLDSPLGCGWCGGAHCETTARGCFNASLHDHPSTARHEEGGPICSDAHLHLRCTSRLRRAARRRPPINEVAAG